MRTFLALAVVAALFPSCGHPLRPEALLTQWGQPCEQAVVNVAQISLACTEIYPEPHRSACLGKVAEASEYRRLRYCTGGASLSNCAAPGCYHVGDYWFADDECLVANFGPPPPGNLEGLLLRDEGRDRR